MPFLIGIEIQLRRDAKYIRISLAWQLSIYIYLVQMDLFFLSSAHLIAKSSVHTSDPLDST